MLVQVKNDCSKRTGDITLKVFVENCREILDKEDYFPLADSNSIDSMCSLLRKQATKGDKCTSLSKILVKQYLLTEIQPVLNYLLQFATSDSFVNAIFSYMETSWDLTKFDISQTNAISLAEMQLGSSAL